MKNPSHKRPCHIRPEDVSTAWGWLRPSQVKICVEDEISRTAKLKPGIRVGIDCEIEHDSFPATLFITFEKELKGKELKTATPEEVGRGNVKRFGRFKLANGIEFNHLPPTTLTNETLHSIVQENESYPTTEPKGALEMILAYVASCRGTLALTCALRREHGFNLKPEVVVSDRYSEIIFSVGSYYSLVDVPNNERKLAELFSQVLDFDPRTQPRPADES